MSGSSRMKKMQHTTAVRIGPLRVGIASNHPAHMPVFPGPIEVKSLLTDFLSVEPISYTEGLDGYIHIEESEGQPSCRYCDGIFTLRGPIRKLSEGATDQRYSLWGNQGLLYRFALHLLEVSHQIFNLHACALYSPEQRALFVIAGGAGSGKTVYLLSGLAKGLRLFSTETVHLELRGDSTLWHMGSLVDNIRLGTLKYDFPEFLPDIPLPLSSDRIWQEKVALDLTPYRWAEEALPDPDSIVLLFPHIEMGRGGFFMDRMPCREKASKLLFDNISEKVSESFVLYDTLAVPGFDTDSSAQHRIDVMRKFVQNPRIRMIASVLSDPQHCWGNILTEITQGDST